MKIAAIIVAAGAAVFAVSLAVFAPPLEKAEKYPGGIILRDGAGKILRVSLGEGDADSRPYYVADKNDWIVKALIASEDGRFERHFGVDFLSMARAFFQNVFFMKRISGASTITMQATRLIEPHPKSYVHKFIEACKAMRLEMARDKMWIVSQYLNRAPFGSNLIGIEAAANGWFGKTAKTLGIGEAALLAGMVQAPSRFRPDRRLNRALKRREYVLSRMLAHGMISEEQYEGARKVIPRIMRGTRPFAEPFFCDYAAEQVESGFHSGGGYGDYVTTLNMDIQEAANNVAVQTARAHGCSVAAVVMDVRRGAVVALACSDDYFAKDAGQVNTALAPRSAGSTLKPFLTALALDRGIVTPNEKLADIPKTYHYYNPANFDSSYRGMVSLSDALVLSLNLPFLSMLERVGVTSFGTLLRSLGCSHLDKLDETYGLGMAIGNVEVSLVELAGAYGAIARGGVRVEPTAMKHVADKSRDGIRIFSEGASWVVTDVLSREERAMAALGHVADVNMARFAWKTGTSSAYRDAWTVAWNPEYVVGVWCGYKEGFIGNESLVGARAAAPAAWQLVRSLYPSGNGPWYERPDSVEAVTVCRESGMNASAACEQTEEGWTIRGRSSQALCSIHTYGEGGKVVTRENPLLSVWRGMTDDVKSISISSPENNSVYYVVPGVKSQRIVCKVAGNSGDGKLWWFVDNRLTGITKGNKHFVWKPAVGEHIISCTTAKGVSASVRITILNHSDTFPGVSRRKIIRNP